MNAQKARAAVEDMAVHYGALSDAKEDCNTQEDKRNLKRAAKALAAEKSEQVKADAEELATLMNEIGL